MGARRRSMPDLVETAKKGAAILSKKRGCDAQLARIIGVFRAQPSKWASGESTPRRRALKCLKILARLSDHVDKAKTSARDGLIELGCEINFD